MVTAGEMLRNKEAFILAVQEHMNVDPAALLVLMDAPLPNNTEVSQDLHVMSFTISALFVAALWCLLFDIFALIIQGFIFLQNNEHTCNSVIAGQMDLSDQIKSN